MPILPRPSVSDTEVVVLPSPAFVGVMAVVITASGGVAKRLFVFEQAVDANPPPAVSGRRLKLNYITQAKARPPSFILFCSRADAVPQPYLRYLTNSMREAFDLPGTPIRITLREKANPFAHKRKRPS